MEISFDDCVFDRERRELYRDGAVVHLSPKAFTLLEKLLLAAPAAVSREVLYRELWGDAFVEEVNLSNLIAEIRSALGEAARESRYVKTVHRFGYRFVAPLRTRAAVGRAKYFLDWKSSEHPLQDGDNIVGRDRAASVQIEVAGVSRRHAIIRIAQDEVTIEDLASKNGTFIDGSRVTTAVRLEPGNTIALGSVSLTLRQHLDVESTMTEVKTPDQPLIP